MKIEVHSLLHNEAKLIPYFMRHYGQFADVYFYESDSTDGSREIAQALGATVIDFPTNNEVSDTRFLEMKNNCWKDSKADWVIICDTDEFVYHPEIISIIKHTHYTAFYPKEYRMYSDVFPTTEGQIYEEVFMGVPGAKGANKMNIFKPRDIQETNYTVGCHSCNPKGNVIMCTDTDIKTLHFHHLSKEYRLNKNKELASRLSKENRNKNWGSHTLLPKEVVEKQWDEQVKNLIKIV